jgi:hypothetical protein
MKWTNHYRAMSCRRQKNLGMSFKRMTLVRFLKVQSASISKTGVDHALFNFDTRTISPHISHLHERPARTEVLRGIRKPFVFNRCCSFWGSPGNAYDLRASPWWCYGDFSPIREPPLLPQLILAYRLVRTNDNDPGR